MAQRIPKFLWDLYGIEKPTGSSTSTLSWNPDGTLTWDPIFSDNTSLSSSFSKTINQPYHTFVKGNILTTNDTGYILAKANSPLTADVIGIITDTSDNTFTITFGGYITGLSGLIAGSTYFLSSSVDGDWTNIEPTAIGSVSKPIFIADSETSGYWINYRGIVIAEYSGGNNLTPAERASAGEIVQVVGYGIGGLPDPATQAAIDSLLAIGWPETSIWWRYLGESTGSTEPPEDPEVSTTVIINNLGFNTGLGNILVSANVINNAEVIISPFSLDIALTDIYVEDGQIVKVNVPSFVSGFGFIQPSITAIAQENAAYQIPAFHLTNILSEPSITIEAPVVMDTFDTGDDGWVFVGVNTFRKAGGYNSSHCIQVSGAEEYNEEWKDYEYSYGTATKIISHGAGTMKFMIKDEGSDGILTVYEGDQLRATILPGVYTSWTQHTVQLLGNSPNISFNVYYGSAYLIDNVILPA